MIVTGRCLDCGDEWQERTPERIEICPECYSLNVEEVDAIDPEYADVDEAGQLSLGVAGEQRAIPGLARARDVIVSRDGLRDADTGRLLEAKPRPPIENVTRPW